MDAITDPSVAQRDPMTPADDALLSLKDACEIFFRGKVTVATLKAEHTRGNLDIARVTRPTDPC
mgnify:CR=1 FL=1